MNLELVKSIGDLSAAPLMFLLAVLFLRHIRYSRTAEQQFQAELQATQLNHLSELAAAIQESRRTNEQMLVMLGHINGKLTRSS